MILVLLLRGILVAAAFHLDPLVLILKTNCAYILNIILASKISYLSSLWSFCLSIAYLSVLSFSSYFKIPKFTPTIQKQSLLTIFPASFYKITDPCDFLENKPFQKLNSKLSHIHNNYLEFDTPLLIINYL